MAYFLFSKGGIFMIFSLEGKLIGKNAVPYIDKNTGTEKFSYTANIAQEGGSIVGSLSISKEIFEILENDENYIFKIVDSRGSRGLFIRVIGVTRFS